MILPLPNLDDRRWVDLAEEGRNLIPRYALEWTDFNVHDPGITLIELLAWVAEMDVFQLNRIPDSHRLKFLALLGITPRPPQAAHTILQVSPKNNASIDLPATIEFETEHPPRNSVRFRTLDPLTIVLTELKALWRHDEMGWHNLTPLWENGEPVLMFGETPSANSAFYLGFSKQPRPDDDEDKTLTLYLRFAGGKSGPDERGRILAEWLQAREDCPPPANPCQPDEVATPAAEPPPTWQHHSARTAWEYAQSFDGQIVWRRLEPEKDEVIDGTRACTLDGFVRLTLPTPTAAIPLASSGEPFYYVRCRLVAGEYDAPPILQTALVNAVAVEQAVPETTRFTIAQGATISGPLPSAGHPAKFSLQFNAAGEIAELSFLPMEHDAPEFFITYWQEPTYFASGVLGVELRFMGPGLSEPSQAITLQPAPVQAESVGVYTLEEGVWQIWSRRRDFDASSRSDRHYLLHETSGTLTFGDGEKGLPVPEGAPIFVTFRSTQAETGNVPQNANWALSGSAHNRALIDVAATQPNLREVSNPFPATGGAQAETVTHAEGRALEEAHRVTRAVTLSDVEHLARMTPGTHLARVAAKANMDARYPCLRAPGMISVVLLPNTPVPEPQPSTGLRATVQRYLDRRRIIGSRVEVVGPEYTRVTVRARVQSQTGADTARVRQAVIQALHDFFDPRHGGPEKGGWPFGRDVYRSEVLHTIDSVAGVENVSALELIAGEDEPSCGNLCLGPCGLVVSGEHEIVVD